MAKSSFCSVCAAEGVVEIHHIVPLSLGGPDTLANTIELCLSCHSKAHSHREEWRKKVREGIEKAKREGRYKGRPASIDKKLVVQLKSQGMGGTNIAKNLGIGRASVYRILREKKNEEE
jgi:predicted transcriptional regulator YheO